MLKSGDIFEVKGTIFLVQGWCEGECEVTHLIDPYDDKEIKELMDNLQCSGFFKQEVLEANKNFIRIIRHVDF
jgi:hypothetical protein